MTTELTAHRSADRRHVDLGPSDDTTRLPRRIVIDGSVWFLARNPLAPSGAHLLSSACPHQGGEIGDAGDCFACPNHGWRFDRQSGASINAPGRGMASIPVVAENGRWFADLGASPHFDRATAGISVPRRTTNLAVRLIAHACLELRHQDFSLLTDPWLDGPAFLGAWTQYPPSAASARELAPDAILISHEHSDHFHEPTLASFDRATPIYFPDFPNRRIPERLAALGFTHTRALRFGEAVVIGGGFRLTCFEPASLWNDSAVLIEAGDHRFLNLNDAGLNRRIARAVAPVDVVASSFSPGASGYPLTWTHLSAQRVEEILMRAQEGHLRMLGAAAELYGAPAVLPFASHFALWHPEHEAYARALRKNTVAGVVRAFEGSTTRVIDLAPGDTWRAVDDSIARGNRAANALRGESDVESMIEHVRATFDISQFEASFPSDETLTCAELERYILALNRTPDIAFCEDVVVSIRATHAFVAATRLGALNERSSAHNDGGSVAPIDMAIESRAGEHGQTASSIGAVDHLNSNTRARATIRFAIRNGVLSILETPGDADLTIEIPAGILAKIVRENLSWDEALIGYWCRCTRQPDVYHAGFWRLLQSPYFAKPAELTSGQDSYALSETTVIAGLLERFGDRADRIIRRYGLYCAGCAHSTADTLAQGARHHGLDEDQLARLLDELSASLVGARFPNANARGDEPT